MQFNKKSDHLILGMLAVSFALFFPVCASTSFAQPFASAIHTYDLGGAPQSGDACQPVFAALEKNITTAYHMYMTRTSAAVQGGKPRNTEIISVGGTMYVMVGDKWTARPNSAERQKANVEQARENAKTGTCRYVRDEAVNGESAALIATHNQSEFGTSDAQIWISKSRGLILKQETDIEVGGGAPKSHASARYEFTNVQAPKM